MAKPVVRQTLVSKLVPNPLNPREDLNIKSLVLSISTDGFDPSQPIVGSLQPDDTILILRGHRRHAAILNIIAENRERAKELGLEKIPVLVYSGLSDSEQLSILFDHNSKLNRKSLTFMEQCKVTRALNDCGMTQQQIGVKIGCSRSTVQKYLAVNRWQDDSHPAYDALRFAIDNPKESKIRTNDILTMDAQLIKNTLNLDEWKANGNPATERILKIESGKLPAILTGWTMEEIIEAAVKTAEKETVTMAD